MCEKRAVAIIHASLHNTCPPTYETSRAAVHVHRPQMYPYKECYVLHSEPDGYASWTLLPVVGSWYELPCEIMGYHIPSNIVLSFIAIVRSKVVVLLIGLRYR